jgi:hypothetical protein
MAKDVTIEVLKQIRDEVVGLRGEMRETRTVLSERIDRTNEKIDQTNEKVDTLARRQNETEIRLATELVAVSQAVNGVREASAGRARA